MVGHINFKGSIISIETARSVIDVASEGQASDIVLIDVSNVSDYCDHLIIMTADNNRQIDNLAKKIKEMMWRMGAPIRHIEGEPESGWVLLDQGNLVTHIFSEEKRSMYDLDELWNTGVALVRVQ